MEQNREDYIFVDYSPFLRTLTSEDQYSIVEILLSPDALYLFDISVTRDTISDINSALISNIDYFFESFTSSYIPTDIDYNPTNIEYQLLYNAILVFKESILAYFNIYNTPMIVSLYSVRTNEVNDLYMVYHVRPI